MLKTLVKNARDAARPRSRLTATAGGVPAGLNLFQDELIRADL